MKTFSQRKEDVKAGWRVLDATDKVLGRLATEVATILRGKDKPTFTPHIDGGDHVVVVNAAKIKLTGNKWDDKKYYRYSGYRGGMKERTAKEILAKKPEELIELAVIGMLPKGSLGRKMFTKLKVYAGSEHPHEAQKPISTSS